MSFESKKASCANRYFGECTRSDHPLRDGAELPACAESTCPRFNVDGDYVAYFKSTLSHLVKQQLHLMRALLVASQASLDGDRATLNKKMLDIIDDELAGRGSK